MARYTGVVKWFNTQKGFGFIGKPNAASDWPQKEGDIFVHYTAIQAMRYKELHEGEQVEFEVEDGQNNKLQAVRVQKIDADNSKQS